MTLPVASQDNTTFLYDKRVSKRRIDDSVKTIIWQGYLQIRWIAPGILPSALTSCWNFSRSREIYSSTSDDSKD